MNNSQPIYQEPGKYGAVPEVLVRELARSGFWANLLGSLTFAGVLASILIILFATASVAKKKPLPKSAPIAESVPALPAEVAPMPKPASTSPPAPSPSPGNAIMGVVFGGIGLAVILLQITAALGMLVMLLRFGNSTKRLAKKPTMERLERTIALQRWLWTCIGIFAACGILSVVVFILQIVAVVAASGTAQM